MSEVDDFIAHFGRKGMKWGKVNEPKEKSSPSVKKTAKREVKAEKHEVTAAKNRIEKAKLEKDLAGKSKYNVVGKSRQKSKISGIEKDIKSSEKEADRARKGELSSRQRKVLIGAAVAGTIVAAYGSRYAVQNGQVTRAVTIGKAAMRGDRKDLFKKNKAFADPTLSADDIMSKVVRGINPGFGTDWGTNMNCRRATFAYEMRRRGNDVQATRTSNGSGQTAFGLVRAVTDRRMNLEQKVNKINDEYENSIGRKAINFTTPKDIFDQLAREPERSRGEFGVQWKGRNEGIPGGGHSMAYEIINGKAHIFDTQLGKEYKEDDSVFSQILNASHTRLDDQKLNETFLAKWVR